MRMQETEEKYMTLKAGDSWDAQMELMDRWSEAGGTRNLRIAKPFKVKGEAMAKRLRDAGVKHPFEKS